MVHGGGELVVVTTLDDENKARQFAHLLVEQRLAACVTVLPEARSYYRWQSDEIRSDSEIVLLIKTHRERLQVLEQYFREHHPYECPEIIALDAAELSAGYRDWLRTELGLN